MATSESAQAQTIEPATDQSVDPLQRILSHPLRLKWETIVYLVIFALAIFTRFYVLGDRVMSHDESLHTRYSYNLYADGNFQHTPLMHGPILFHATALFYFLFGADDFTSRIYPALLGVLMVMFPVLLRRWLGRWGAILTSVMFLASPLLMYYNRYIRHDTPSIVAALIMVYCILMYLNGPENQRRRARWLYIFSAAMLWNLGSKETSFIYIVIFTAFLLLYWITRLIQHIANTPLKSAFYTLMVGILLGGVASLGLYVILEIVPFNTANAAAQATGWFRNVESRSFIVWILLTVIAIAGATIGTMLWAFRGGRTAPRWQDLVLLICIAVIVAMALVLFEEASHIQPLADETAQPLMPGEDTVSAGATLNLRWWPMILVWVLSAVMVAVLVYSKSAGWWETLRQFPELDILIVVFSLILPWATAVVPKLMHGNTSDYALIAEKLPAFIVNGVTNITNQFSTLPVGLIVLYFLAAVPLFVVAIATGLVWDWKRWLICVAVFYILFSFFATTMFTNIWGLFSGMFYSLGYWLEQQGVRRGSQPQYYYLLIIMPFYEFLPVIGSVLAMLAGLTLFWKQRRKQFERELDETIATQIDDNVAETEIETMTDSATIADDVPSLDVVLAPIEMGDAEAALMAHNVQSDGWLKQLPFLLFVAWWGILNLVGYSLAGEKMPWLGTHLTVPLILLTAWYFGRIIDKINFRKFMERGWLYLLLLPLLFVTLFQVAAPLLAGQMPTGLTQIKLAQTGQWFAVVLISAVLIFIIYRLVETTGWKHLRRMFSVAVFISLAVITFRSAWMASFINYDYATEYLVYAHAAPAVKTVLDDLKELSLRTTDGMDLVFGYDNEVSWPYSWYFRDFPNAIYFGDNPTLQRLNNAVAVVVGEANRAKIEPLLEDRYYHFEYIRLWWPMQDYFNLTAERIANVVDLSPENEQAPKIRRGLFDIWWSRDYTAYGEAVGRDFNVTRWPVSDRMHFYVRKDVAAQIWPYGVGEGTVGIQDETTTNLCTANWQQLYATTIFDTSTAPLNRPIGISIGPDGNVYVAEEYGFHISVFDRDGNFIKTIGQQGGTELSGAFFNRPNSVAVAPDGTLYVADTWNYRIEALSPDGELKAQWGQMREDGFSATTEPTDGLWGPRDVKVDDLGQVYVADTGNKRVRVYTADGVWLRDIGYGGSGLGQLDEPSGLAIHPDGRVFVADTWNRRISVFTRDGVALSNFSVRGWYEELGNRPYLAIDPARNLLYVTDPDGGRMLVYDLDGNCRGSFGQYNSDLPDGSQFSVVGGIAVDADGFVYVADSGTGRVLKFAPFNPAPLPDTANEQPQVFLEYTEEVTDEAIPLFDEEMTQEVTAEIQPLDTGS